jgi:hypothetical protein
MEENGSYLELVEYSQKIKFALELMKNLKKEGHKLLIFSMSKQILNLLE